MSDSETRCETMSQTNRETWEAIKEMIDPVEQISRSAARNQEMDLLNQVIGAEDTRALLADVRRKERSRVVIDEKSGLMRYEDDPMQTEEEMGDIHVGPKIEVRQVERSDAPQQQPVQAQPQLPQSNGTAGKVATIVLGSVLGGGLMAGAGAALYAALSKPDPPAVEKPSDPPEVRLRIR